MTKAGSRTAVPPPVRVVRWGGEKQLVAVRDVEAGALLSAEYPIAFVEIQAGEDEVAPLLLLESILVSEATFARVVAEDFKMTKWPLSADDAERLAQLATRYQRNPRKLIDFYHRVAANNIRYAQGGVIGFGIWPIVSRSNHSCVPNARLSALADKPLLELLRATQAIPAGAAVCWNYYADPAFLELSWHERNARLLRDFQFLCRCPRCEAEQPAELAAWSKARIAAYFRRSSSTDHFGSA